MSLEILGIVLICSISFLSIFTYLGWKERKKNERLLEEPEEKLEENQKKRSEYA
jgi:hypothetical protein